MRLVCLLLQFLVTLQAGLTLVGNFTLWWGAWRIHEDAQTNRA
jgi:hypothetical protein